MKRLFHIISIAAVLFVLFACGEDRSNEYEEKTLCDHWMADIMSQKYLWGDRIMVDEIPWKSFFAAPKTFFADLTKFSPIGDTWSWCTVDTIDDDGHQRGYFNHFDSYGIDFILMADPTNATSRQYARVMTVIPGSPADKCGLERGDFISHVDGNRMASSYTSLLVNGKARTLVVAKLDVDYDENEFFWAQVDTLRMERSEYVEDVPYPVCKNFKIGDTDVAYLMCNRLSEGPDELDEQSTDYFLQLEKAVKSLQQYRPKVLVVDFRLCNYGTLMMANKFASSILGTAYAGEIFAKTIYSQTRSSENQTILLDNEALEHAIVPEDVFFIISEQTSGAPEWVIRAVQNVMGESNVFTVGDTSDGQIVLTEDIKSQFAVTLHPAVAYVANALGEYGYLDGIVPDVLKNEASYVKLYPYGDENEALLKFVLDEVENMY